MYSTPIFINNRDHLTDLVGLLDDLLSRGYTNIHIMDNGSDYPPLIQWYDSYSHPSVEIHKFENLGPRCFWDSGLCEKFKEEPYVVITTSDIRLNSLTPSNFVQDMKEKLEQHPSYEKIGLALSLDFERNSEYQKESGNWEDQFWRNQIEHNLYVADVDDTFCIFRPNRPFTYTALRLGGNYTAKHTTWWVDFEKGIPEEELYYLERASDDSFFKRHYNNWLNSKN